MKYRFLLANYKPSELSVHFDECFDLHKRYSSMNIGYFSNWANLLHLKMYIIND